ncbi:unnamed protein product [Mytilus edulis]|uniref:Uncharacterized protein n=1 Tax=Mytilus edulis TaxID=6550 RepID=A0A8S3S2B2_MYTED|nr:unnamed protein product [Mytilus edulis]
MIIHLDSNKSQKFNYFKGNYDKMRDTLNLNWTELLDGKCTEDMIGIFMDKLTDTMNECIPKSKPNSKKKGKTPLSSEAVRCIKRKQRLWTRYLETRDSTRYRDHCRAKNSEKAEVLAEFFSSVFTLESDNPVDSGKRYCDCFSSDELFNSKEVNKILIHLNHQAQMMCTQKF